MEAVPQPPIQAPAPPMPPTPPAPPPAPPVQQQQYAGGGFLKQFDWVEVGILIAGAYALFCVIDYYRKKAKAEKDGQATVKELTDQVDTLNNKMNFVGKKLGLRSRPAA